MAETRSQPENLHSVAMQVEWKGKSESEVAQSCPTLCDPVNCSLPGSSVLGIFQARILEWIPLEYPGGRGPEGQGRLHRSALPGGRSALRGGLGTPEPPVHEFPLEGIPISMKKVLSD